MNPVLHALIDLGAFALGMLLAEIAYRVRRRRRVRSTLETQLRAMRDYAQARIEGGDLDLDDRIYRTRDACATLLALHFGDSDGGAA